MTKHLLKVFFLAASCGIVFITKTSINGQGPGYTNAPSEGNCAQSGCHNSSSLITSGTKWSGIDISSNFTGSGYIPDSSYTIILKYKESGKSRFGYQITALDEATGAPAGTFSTVDSRSQRYTLSVGGKTRDYLGHTNAGTADSCNWKIRWKAPSSNVGKVVFYATLNVTDAGGGVGGDEIYAKTFKLPPSTLLPSVKVKIVDSFYCSSTQLTFDATSTSTLTSWNWTFASGTPSSSTSQNPKVSYSTPGTYKAILKGKNNKGFSIPDTLTFVVVQGAGNPTINPGGTKNICSGDSLTLNATIPAGHTALWSSGQKTASIKVADSGNYTVTVKNSNKCIKTSAATVVKVKSKPSVLLIKSYSTDTVCAGVPLSIAGFIMSGPVDSFSFNSAAGPYSKSDTQNHILSSGPVTYKVWGKNSFGCVSPASSTTTHVKQPQAAPIISVSNISFTSMTFNWTSVPDATSYRISLDTGKTWLTPSNGDTGHMHVITGLLGNTAILAMVRANTPGQCLTSLIGSKEGKTLTCSDIPITIEIPNPWVCKNSTTTIILHGLKGKKIGVKIDGVAKSSDTIQSITVVGSKNYQVSVIDSAVLVCGYTIKNITLTEDTVNIPQWNLGQTVGFCSNVGTVSLPAIVTFDKTADSILYIRNVSSPVTKTSLSHTFSVNHGDSVWIVAKNNRGCVSKPSKKTAVSVINIPNASFTNKNTFFIYHFYATQGGGNHIWTFGTSTKNGDSANFDFTGKENTTVKIKHRITVNGCSAEDSISFTVPDFNSVHNLGIAGLQIYPNPAADILQIRIPKLNTNASLELLNTAGQLVFTATLKQGINTLQTAALPEGLYMYKITTNSSQATGNIIIGR